MSHCQKGSDYEALALWSGKPSEQIALTIPMKVLYQTAPQLCIQLIEPITLASS